MKSRSSLQQQIVQLQQRLLQDRQLPGGGGVTAEALQAVRHAHHDRIRQVCGDWLAQPGLEPAQRFFFGQLYPVRWPDWRDGQCLRTFPRMVRVMPLSACEVLLQAVELDAHTFALDVRVARHGSVSPGERALQRDRMVLLGRGLVAVSRLPLMSLLLKAAGPVARRQGLGELHRFFSDGLAAFQAIPNPGEWLDRLEALDLTGNS